MVRIVCPSSFRWLRLSPLVRRLVPLVLLMHLMANKKFLSLWLACSHRRGRLHAGLLFFFSSRRRHTRCSREEFRRVLFRSRPRRYLSLARPGRRRRFAAVQIFSRGLSRRALEVRATAHPPWQGGGR